MWRNNMQTAAQASLGWEIVPTPLAVPELRPAVRLVPDHPNDAEALADYLPWLKLRHGTFEVAIPLPPQVAAKDRVRFQQHGELLRQSSGARGKSRIPLKMPPPGENSSKSSPANYSVALLVWAMEEAKFIACGDESSGPADSAWLSPASSGPWRHPWRGHPLFCRGCLG